MSAVWNVEESMRRFHKGRPQNLTPFLLCPHILVFYRQKLTVASAFGRPPLLVRTSFIIYGLPLKAMRSHNTRFYLILDLSRISEHHGCTA